MKNVIFLDFDGVLVTTFYMSYLLCRDQNHATAPSYDQFGHTFDPNSVRCLKLIIEQNNANIVISSSWRLYGGIERMQEMWKYRDLPGNVIGITPDINSVRIIPYHRGKEIKLWLDKNPVDNFLILDDNDNILPELKPNFIQTTLENGLTSSHITQARWILSSNDK